MAPGAAEELERIRALDFGREIARLTEDFTGRDWLFQEIDAWIRRGNEPLFLLTGEPGVGKSAIAARLIQIRNDIGAYHFCIANQAQTVTPGVVLRSLAAQLIQNCPGYPLALLNTIKPVHRSVAVNIQVDTMIGGRVTGFEIGYLTSADPKQEFEILLRAPLAALPVPQAALLLLVDSLDEAVTFAGAPNLVALLAQELPSWVRLLCTSRPERRVMRYFDLRNPFVLAAELGSNLEDIRRYVTSRVSREALHDRLQMARVEPQTLVERLTKELSAGNFLYTKVLLDDIEAGRQPISDLNALPRSLDDIYHRFLNRFTVVEWQQQYQPIMGVLAAVLEPVTETQLARFTAMERTVLRQNLDVAQQFLDVLESEQGEKIYRLFHQSLRDYLQSEERNQDFWCAPEDGHRRVAGAYGVSEKTCDVDTMEKIDRYGLTHLSTHVLRAGWDEALQQLLGGAWARLKERREGSLAGFLSDVDLAWHGAEADRKVARQIRFGLFQSSVRALASQLPPALLSTLVQKNLWQPVQALRYAQEIADERQRGAALVALAPTLTPDLSGDAARLARAIQYPSERIEPLAALSVRAPQELRGEIAREALETLRALQYDSDRARKLAAISKWLPPELMATALEIALTIPFVDDRASCLAALLPNLADDLLPAARNGVESLDANLPQVVEALMTLALRLPSAEQDKTWRKALAIAANLKDMNSGEVLRLLILELREQLLPCAVTATRDMTQPFVKVAAVVALLPRLPMADRKTLVADGLQAIGQMPSGTDPVRVRWYAKLLAHCPEDQAAGILETALTELRANDWRTARVEGLACLIPRVREADRNALRTEAMLAIGESDNSIRRSEAMVNLAPQLLPVQRSSLMNLVPTMKDEDAESSALAGMAPYLSTDDLRQALEMADGMDEDKHRLLVVEGVAPHLAADDLPRALEVARAIRDRDARAQILLSLALALSHAECPLPPETILKAVNLIVSPTQRALALYRLIPWLPGPLHTEAWTGFVTALRNSKPDDLQHALGLVIGMPEPILDEVLNLIDKLSSSSDRLATLLPLASRLPVPRVKTVIEGILDLPVAGSRAEALVGILPYVADDDRQGCLKALFDRVAHGQEHERARTVAALAPYLQGESLDAALEIAQKLKGNGYRATALSGLVPQLSPQSRESILKAAVQAMTVSQDWSAAEKLAPYLGPDAVRDALTEIRMIDDAKRRTHGLAALLPFEAEIARPKLAKEIVVATKQMPFPVDRLEVLIQIAPFLSEDIRRQEMLAAVQQTQYAHQRARALIDVLPFVASREWSQYLIESLTVGSQWPKTGDRALAWRGLIDAYQRLPEADAHLVWQHGLRALSARPRPELLQDLTLLVPVVRSLGGARAVADSIRAVEEVSAIWP